MTILSPMPLTGALPFNSQRFMWTRLLAGRRNVPARIGPLIDNIASRRNLRPPIPGAKGHVISAPFHLRGELGGGHLSNNDHAPQRGCWWRLTRFPLRPSCLMCKTMDV